MVDTLSRPAIAGHRPHLAEHTGIVEEAAARRKAFAKPRPHRTPACRTRRAHVLAQADRALRNRVSIKILAAQSKRPKVENPIEPSKIIEAVAIVSNIWPDALISEARMRPIAWPRHVAILLMIELRPDISLPSIARIFKRDHTSCLYARDMARQRLRDIHSPSADWYRAAKALLAERFPQAVAA